MNPQQILVKYWGYSSFRPMQEEIIASVLDGKDTLALLPTGGGKSILYQVPAMANDGICLVVSPLIALMKDQVDRLKKIGIKAFAIYSGMHANEVEVALNNAVYGDAKFLYVSPERVATPVFRESLKLMKVNLLAIDEAHCISQWGYDFRPPYLRIAEIRALLPNTPVLAVTATATPPVVEDIQQKLLFKTKNVIQQTFERKNLAYLVFNEENKTGRLIKMLQKVKGSAIIYAQSRRKTYDIAQELTRNQISADYYHAGLDNAQRETKQQAWMTGQSRVMVATNAFGMGIDKADVRIVVHLEPTSNIESYFQEAGRAGRDGKKAYAVMLFQQSDLNDAQTRFESSFPDLDTIKSVYQALGNYLKLAVGSGKNMGFDFEITDFCNQYNFKPVIAYSALKFLEKEGYLILSEGVHFPARIHFKLEGEDLYKFRVENPALDGFVKMLLRSYTGLFSQFVKINEKEIANRSNLPVEKVVQLLTRLNQLNIITYVTQKSKPQLIYTEERIDSKDVYISKENYELRKKAAWERLKAVETYAKASNRCRSQYLLAYFGEQSTKRCGQCDYCIERNKAELSEIEFDIIVEIIKPLLKIKSMAIEEIVDAVPKKSAEKVIRAVEWLLDNDKIKYTTDKKIFWVVG